MMKLLKTIIILMFLFLLLFCTLDLPAQAQAQGKDDQERLKYQVSVEAQLVPIFAVDKKGNPVFDLKPEELTLYADGKRTEIIYFSGYRMEEQVREKVTVETQIPQKVKKPPERMNFIILDTLVSNMNLLGISRAIAMGIVNNASPGDSFVILESNQVRGFQYIYGPERDKKKLAKALKEIEQLFRRRRFYVKPELIREYQMTSGNQKAMVAGVMGADRYMTLMEQERYQRDILTLSQSLEQLKYALKSINVPKTVFLISAGPQRRFTSTGSVAGSVKVPTYFRFLENAAKAINQGGSMFYTINPLMHKSKQVRTALKFMTEPVGGKCIHGTTMKDILDSVKKSTAAYYELAFYPKKKDGLINRVRLKCKRKGVQFITIGYTEKAKTYRQLNSTEKKLFALDVINRGSWSRVMTKVGKIKYKIREKETIEITIPPVMRNRQVDVFLVQVDPRTQKASFTIETRKMGETGALQIPFMEKQNIYFIIVEPAVPLCIYNRVN